MSEYYGEMTDLPLFDGMPVVPEKPRPKTGEDLKREGMELAASNRAELLEDAKAAAKQLAMECGEVHLDMVREKVDGDLGPAAGSVFKGAEWEFTGRRIRSTLPSNHGRELKVWRLK